MLKGIRTLVLSGLVLTCAGAAWAQDLVVKGSTTVLPIAQATAEAFMKSNANVTITISGGGSSEGIKALLDGTAAIANSSRNMKEKEIAEAQSKGVHPVEHKVAMDAIVVMVHPANPVQDLTLDQLKGIYTGQITNWKEVGGEDKPMVVVGRDTSSGTFETWETIVLKKEKVLPGALVVASSGAMLQTVAKNPYAIGYDGIGYLNDSVKGVSVGGVRGAKESALDGSYPISRFLFMYTNGEPTGDTKAFLDFVKSAEGQSIVEQVGFVPVR